MARRVGNSGNLTEPLQSQTSILKLTILVALISTAIAIAVNQVGPVSASSWSNSRIAGDDRYDTAAEVSREHYPGGSSNVIIASGEGFADSLAGSSLAAKLKAPILFVRKTMLPEPTKQELTRLNPFQVLILGGEAAISSSVVSAVQSLNIRDVRRIAGDDRYETAAEIIKWGWPQTAPQVFLVTGERYLPGLLASAVAGKSASPVVPVRPAQVPTAISDELKRLKPTKVIELGYGSNSDALSGLVYSQVLAITGVSITGYRHTDFANAVQDLATVEYQGASFGSKALVVTGETFADALPAGAIAGAFGYPLVFTNRQCMPKAIVSTLGSLGIRDLVVIGGNNAISSASAAGTVCATTTQPPQSSSTTLPSAPPVTTVPRPAGSLPAGTFLVSIQNQSHICRDATLGWNKYDCVRYYNQTFVLFISPDYYCSGSKASPLCSTFWYPSDLETFEIPTSITLNDRTSIGPFLCKRATFTGYGISDYDCSRYSGGNPLYVSFFSAYKCTRKISFECRTDYYPSEIEGLEIRTIGWDRYVCERSFWGYECFRYWGLGSPRDAIGFFPDYYCNTWWQCRTDRMP